MSFQMDAKDVDNLIRTLQNAGGKIPKGVSDFLQTKGDAIIKDYHDAVPVRTGRLQRSIEGGLQGTNKYVGGATVIYAPIVERKRGNLKQAWDNGMATMESDIQAMMESLFS